MINWNFPYNSKEWLTLREKHLWMQPYCQECQTTLNLHVDHIIEHFNDVNVFLDPKNLQTLCASCHGKKTNEFVKLKYLPTAPHIIKISLNDKNGSMVVQDWFFKSYPSTIDYTPISKEQNLYNFKFSNATLTPLQLGLLLDLTYRFFIQKGFKTFNFQYQNCDDLLLAKIITERLQKYDNDQI